ncbi:subtilisin-like serine protease [Ceratobasidium sp. 392]|nr:subtilisin-like serine protease [Ceratobasidium sp. 392]
MHFPATLSALVLVVPVLSAPTLMPITKRAGPVKADSYIVMFKDVESKDAFMRTGPTFTQSGSSVTYNYNIIPAAAMILNGKDDLNRVQKLDGVESIEPDSIVSIHYEDGLDGLNTSGLQNSASSINPPRQRQNMGEGVDVYGIDTVGFLAFTFSTVALEVVLAGVQRMEGQVPSPMCPYPNTHTRAQYMDKDGNGHGTHTAGTAVCSNFKPGVAGKANIIAVKVLSDAGSGSNSDVIMGAQYALEQFQATSKPSIATLSLGGTKTESLNSAIREAIGKGLHFTVAAGNSNLPADGFSPASVKEANTIGAVDSDNKKASFSNFGSLIDVWYYGVNVESAWIDGPNSTRVLSGTSMATPGVAGILAAYLSRDGNGKTSPADLTKQLQKNAQHAVKNEAGAPIVGSTDLLTVPF